MKAELQRIKIAEACGIQPTVFRGLAVRNDSLCELPDYLNDRNAMAEAVQTLPPHYKAQFGAQLAILVSERYIGKWNEVHQAIQLAEIGTAPASVMAEAFLKAVYEWEDKHKPQPESVKKETINRGDG